MTRLDSIAKTAPEGADAHLQQQVTASAADRQQAYRDRQRALGRAPRLLYLTDAELAEVKALIRKLRALVP